MRDGIHQMLLPHEMCESARMRRDIYEIKKNTGWVNTEFGYYSLNAWKKQGFIEGEHDPWVYDKYIKEKFFIGDDGQIFIDGANWEAAEFYPRFDEIVLEDRGDKVVAQDEYGRSVLYFKSSKNGYMPEYLDHPVKDIKSFKEKCEWRMNPKTKERYQELDKRIPLAIEAAHKGKMIVQRFCGGYMYLRSLMGPEEIMYLLYDNPKLIYTCMESWFKIADAVSAYHQKFVTIDELFFGEDITYNNGPLISPAMIRKYIFPYYKKLIDNVKKRQIDKNRKLHLHLDTDGKIETVIPLYKELGFTIFSPFEVASGSNVVNIGKKFEDIVMIGGIDKRYYSKTRQELEIYLDNLLPVMKRRGGYIPTCDHGVPEEAEFNNYIYYRKRCFDISNMKDESIKNNRRTI